MGHIANTDREYRLLQQRLDRMPTGAPDSPVLMQILKMLFTPADAELARRVPSRPTSLDDLSRKVNVPAEALGKKLGELAERGLMLDFERKGRRYFMLPPIVVGFFEFVFMRTRDNLPMTELAKLFDEYMTGDDRFMRSVFQKQTQVGRSLAHEEALPPDGLTETLDWERASRLIQNASAVGVSLCVCRHKAQHLGHACDAPMEACLSLNGAAVALSRSHVARLISKVEGMRILEKCKAAGLAQTGDNVQRNVTYICNCCGCCCAMMAAIRHFDIRNAIMTSNWIMKVDAGRCRGCGLCVKACPIDAIDLADKKAVLDPTLCLGCGVCYSACNREAIRMKPRPQRVLTPETAFERIATMAIERGKLADLIFEDPENLGFRALGRIISLLEKTPPARALMAIKPLKSAFLNAVLKNAK